MAQVSPNYEKDNFGSSNSQFSGFKDDSESLNPCFFGFVRDKRALWSKFIRISPEQVRRKLFKSSSPARPATSRSLLCQVAIITVLMMLVWAQVWYLAKSDQTDAARTRSEQEFKRLQRATEMINIIRNISKELVQKLDDVTERSSDVTVTAERILFDSESAEHVDAEALAPALTRPRGWDLALPFTSDDVTEPGSDVTKRATTCWTAKSTTNDAQTKAGKPPPDIKQTANSDFFCTPSFYFMGFAHSNAQDIFTHLKSHSKIASLPKGSLWWTKVNFKHKMSQLCRSFGDVIRYRSPDTVLGDLDETMILHMANRIPETRTMDYTKRPAAPRLMTPYMLQAMHPEIKFIVVIQNPIDALYSAFLSVQNEGSETRTPQMFHYRVVQLTNLYTACFRSDNIRACVYDPLLAHEASEAHIPLHNHFHAVVLADWLQVFKREHFHIFRLEDYIEKRKTALESIFHFLNIENPESWNYFLKPLPEKGAKAAMLPESRIVLREFFKPHMLALSMILGSEDWLWGEFTAKEMQVVN